MNFKEVFPQSRSLIGMLHLSGGDIQEKIKRTRLELNILDGEGFDGAIFENYHGDDNDLMSVLAATEDMNLRLAKGINFLGNTELAFELAKKYNLKFIQIDSVQHNHLDLKSYARLRDSNIPVLGGVGFKYTSASNWPLEKEILWCKDKCEAIVTTGDGTGIETPIEKLRLFRTLMGDFPLVSGAGVNKKNIYEQLIVADAAIIGFYLKEGNTQSLILKDRCAELVAIVSGLR